MKLWIVMLVTLLCVIGLPLTGFAAPLDQDAPPAAEPSQEVEPVTVDAARPVTAIIDETYSYLATISPNGESIAWGKQSGKGKNRVLQFCLYEFETAAKNCADLSPDSFYGYPYQLQWSPDSRYLAFSENPVELANESDIWLLDTEEETFTNLTDDGLAGSWNSLISEGERAELDYLPMWHPADEEIYFWRIVPLGNLRFTIGIYRVGLDGEEAVLVRDLTADFADRVPLFQYEELFLDGMSALSPDGETVVVLMTSINDMGIFEHTLWSIDLVDPDAEPLLLADVEDFRSALPDWAQDFPPQAQGLAWTGDGAGIVVVVNSQVSASTPFQVYYYVDANGEEITPVVDFSGLEEVESYAEPAPGSDLPWRVYSPWTGSLSPAGDKLLLINDLGGVVALFTAPLPPTGELPMVSASADESQYSGTATASRGDGGKVLAYDLLLTISEE
jgi:hypothetical protein